MLEGDIRGCFDNISHDWLLKNVSKDSVVLRKWLQAGFVDRGVLFPQRQERRKPGIAGTAGQAGR